MSGGDCQMQEQIAIDQIESTGEPMHLVSLGAGVQSSAMALMAARGEITPMPSAAIFADTQAEPDSVYKWLDWLETQLPFPVVRTTAGSLIDACMTVKTNRKTGSHYYTNLIPAYIVNGNGTVGRLERHCTYNYKIIPILRKQKQLAGVRRRKKGQPPTAYVVSWLGISLDEITRAKPSREWWCKSRWPLLEKRMTRQKCLNWMESKGYPEPPRSACTCCPYRSYKEWRRLQAEEPDSFQAACEFERDLQQLHASFSANGKINGVPYLTRVCRPLDEIDFRSDAELGQLSLWRDCGN